MTIQEIRKQFKIDQLIDLYVKAGKDVTVYQRLLPNREVWQGWTIKKGQIIGKLWSFADGSNPANPYAPPLDIDGIYMMFEVNGQPGKFFFVKLESNTLDWPFTAAQINAERQRAMNWYERWYEDLNDALDNFYEQTVLPYGTIAIVALLGLLYWNNIGKYQFFAKQLRREVTRTVRELR